MYICFFYPNIQLHLSQHLECSSDVPLDNLLFYCTFWNSCLCTTLLYFSFYRICCHFPVPPQFLLSCSIFWAQDLTSFLFQHSFSYCILSPILYTLHPHHFSSPCFFLSPVPCFLAKVILYIFYLSFEKETLFLVFIDLNSLVFTPPTIYIGCHCLLCDLFSLE